MQEAKGIVQHIDRKLLSSGIHWCYRFFPLTHQVELSQNFSGLVPPLPGSCHLFWAGGTPSRLAPPLLGWRHPHWAHAIPSGLTPTLLGWRYPFWAGATSSGLAPPVLCSSNPFWARATPSGLGRPHYGSKVFKSTHLGEKVTHSLTPLAPQCSIPLHSVLLCCALLQSAPLHCAPLRSGAHS